MSSVQLSSAQSPFILVIDIGTSSLRALVYDANAREVENFIARVKYQPDTTDDGGSTLDARAMFAAFTRALDEIHALIQNKIEIAAVAACSLASNVLALDAQFEPLTPAFLYADTRNANVVEQLRAAHDWSPLYARTGCPLHTAYLPARFLWLRQTQPEIFSRAAHFVSLHEFFLEKLFERAGVAHSFAAWTGMLNHATKDWDEQVIQVAGIERAQLSPLCSITAAFTELRAEFAARWKLLARIPWYPALGDGAAANVGSGCVDETRVAITIGTSGALRVVMDAQRGLETLPRGLWMYRVDERAGLVGGALTDGGSILRYFGNIFSTMEHAELQAELERMKPDAHGLTFLPFFAGERSPGYHGDARATLTGWNLNTTPLEIARAAMEAVAYRFAAMYDLLRVAIPQPREIVASGGALLHSRAWMQILADVLNVSVTASGEEEASARGAALLALRSLGILPSLETLPASLGETFAPNPAHYEIYQSARKRHESLYYLILDASPLTPLLKF
mgnify:CR=1 FL=1